MKTGEQKLKKTIDFAIKNPTLIDFAETLLETKYLIREYETAQLKRNLDLAEAVAQSLLESSKRLLEITEAMRKIYDEK